MNTPTPDPPPAAPLMAEEIAAIEERCDTATPGPWVADGPDIRAGEYEERIATAFKRVFNHEQYDAAANAAFIAHARTDIPTLLRDNAALRDRLARVEAAGLRVLTSWDQEDEPDIVDAFEALRDILGSPDTSRADGLSSLASLSARAAGCPLDGAARAGDAAGDEEAGA